MGETFGIVGALAADPRRLADCDVDGQEWAFGRGVTRRTTHVVFGRSLLATASAAEIEARVPQERAAGVQLLSENGFLRMLGLRPVGEAEGLTIPRASLLRRAGLSEWDFDMLSLFDAFEGDGEPYSFRDLALAKKYAAQIVGGASWWDVARALHMPSDAVTSPTSFPFKVKDMDRVDSATGERVGRDDHSMARLVAEPDALFEQAEQAEAMERFDEAAAFYARYLSIEPADADAAFNMGNCLAAGGRAEEAQRAFHRALEYNPDCVEARFNLACLLKEQGHIAAARTEFQRAIEADADYADAVYNLAALEFEAGCLAEARRWWARYLELDRESEWSRKAAKGVRYVEMHFGRRHAG